MKTKIEIDRQRRLLIKSTATIAAAQLAGITVGQAQERSATDAITRPLSEAMGAQRAGGKFTCIRTPEANDGPYYYASSPLRSALTEGRKGLPLKLRITVANALIPGDACSPLTGAVVDVWHADADGQYSNVGTDLQLEDTIGQTFMRGHQVTDATGQVDFDSVVPGWELVYNRPVGILIRATHIHVKVFHENKVVTAQLYFPDDFLDELYATVDPYLQHQQMTAPGASGPVNRIRNGEDRAFMADQSKPMAIRRDGDGVFAEATIGINTIGSTGVGSLFR